MLAWTPKTVAARHPLVGVASTWIRAQEMVLVAVAVLCARVGAAGGSAD
jgi:hypothetical protein